MRQPGTQVQGAPGVSGTRGGMNLRCMLVKHSVKYKGALPGPVCTKGVLRVFAWVHEHHRLDAARQRGQGRASQTLAVHPKD